MLPSTADRVPLHTADEYNEAIRRTTEENVARHAAAGPEAIEQRLRELDGVWQIFGMVQIRVTTRGRASRAAG
jgi:hypothetical protein